MGPDLDFRIDRSVSLPDFIDVLRRSTLGERRPLADEVCLQGMLDHADILATCWAGDQLVGIARSVTDFHYCCYLSDLAVDEARQKQGIGARLIELTRQQLGPQAKIILLAAPAATEYYPRLGFDQHHSAWILPQDRSVLAAAQPSTLQE